MDDFVRLVKRVVCFLVTDREFVPGSNHLRKRGFLDFTLGCPVTAKKVVAQKV